MRISEISSQYQVRKLEEGDIDSVYELSVGNPLFYRYCPPYVTKESIREEQGNGVGSAIITELCQCVKRWGYGRLRLCYADGNRQSRSFWIKNGFLSTGEVYPCEGYTAVAMQKIL